MKKKVFFVLCVTVSTIVTMVAVFRYHRKQYISK